MFKKLQKKLGFTAQLFHFHWANFYDQMLVT